MKHFHTFGCKVNTYDTGLLEQKLAKHTADSQIHIINSCAVTHEASKEALALARRLKREHSDAKVVITGCAAQVDSEMFASAEEVDLIVGNSHKEQLPALLEELSKMKPDQKMSQRLYHSNIFAKEDLGEGGGIESHHTRSFLKIQDGCDSFCTYCVIPFARGKSRSLSVAGIIERIQEVQSQNIKEVVLTGIHLGDYRDDNRDDNRDGQQGLVVLLKAILQETSIERLRLGSLEPLEVSDELLSLFANPRLCPHFHMSIQSANDKVLEGMKRNYRRQDVVASLKNVMATVSHAYIGMDVIVGFPIEGDDEFCETYETLASLPWNKIHVFPYSVRPGTYAARLKNIVSPAVKKQRARRLRELSVQRLEVMARQQVGRVKCVLPLSKGDSTAAARLSGLAGLSRDYWPVRIAEGPRRASQENPLSSLQNDEVKVLIREVGPGPEYALLGERLAW